MAKRKPSTKPPQAKHAQPSAASQHDKRKRLQTPNPQRQRTEAANVPLAGHLAAAVGAIGRRLDARIAFRLPILVAGIMLATGRRTAACWMRHAGVGDDWDRFYELLQSVGQNATSLMQPILQTIVRRIDPGPEGYWTLAIDDSPTKRFGPQVQAANIHHNPTPGPGDGEWLYGHNWVTLAMVMRHSIFGVIAMPLLSKLYVRKVDIAELAPKTGWEFKTKHELAAELVIRTIQTLRALGSAASVRVVFDGAYAAGTLVRPLIAQGATVITRLRRDAKLYDLPVNKSGQRGRPRKYGKNRLSLANRAGRRDGWQQCTYDCRGVGKQGRYKTFLATSRIVGGPVRVVLLKHDSGNWAAYISTDVLMSVESILETVADRWSIEEQFHDVKEIRGAGQQQVRNVWSSVGCWHLCGWMYTLVELECWELPAEVLVDRGDRPWDNPERRPSHGDRRRYLCRELLANEFSSVLGGSPDADKIKATFSRLMSLAA